MAFAFRRLLALPLIAIATSVLAQDQADWTLARNESGKVLLAYTEFDVGIGIAIRCSDGGLEALISGLPPSDEDLRTLGIGFPPVEGEEDSGRIHDQQWNVAVDKTMAVSGLPAPFARNVRKGGSLQLRVPGAGEGGRTIRYVLDLPASNAAIDQTLAACGRPLVDPRDAAWEDVGQNGLPSDLNWSRPPRPSYPGTPRYERGFAVVSCIADPQGRPQDCVVETEHPRDAGFGEATLRATRAARLTNTLNPDAAISPQRFNFRANYTVGRSLSPTNGSRIPRD